MNRMPVLRIVLLFSGLLGISAQKTLAQSWTDFNSAVPKVGYPMAYGGVPGTSLPTLTPPPTTAGSIPYVANPTLVPAARNWKLGVYVRNSDLGAVVQTVEPGSASQAAGINPGDIIVAVSTSRIGEFDGRVVDIGDEIRRFVDPYGRVSLLIQDGRTRALRATVVTLSSTSTRMTGTINVSDRGILPVGTVLTVQLQNRNKPFYEIAGGKTMTRAEGTGPFAFELNLDPRYIDPVDQYQLTAFLSWNNQVIYSMPTPVVIPASGLNQNVALMLERGTYLPGANASSLAWSANPAGNVVTAGYSGSTNLPGAVNLDALTQVFVTLLGRQPTSREILAWQSYMQQGHSLNEVTARIMASSQYRDRFTNDSAYMQQVLQTLTGKLPNPTEVGYWVSRLQALGSPERVIAEIMAQNR